ncbi:MAG: CPBP family intramembrane metalloprotease [Bacilli bacterium]|nr:CPBP family intramembrane metalloprotease [Bacilli bacterium]
MNKNKILKSIIAFLIFQYSFLIQYFIVFLFHLSKEQIAKNDFLIIALSTVGSLIVSIIFFVIYRKDLKEDFKKYKENFKKDIDIALTCWGIGLIIMAVCNMILLYGLHSGGANNENMVQHYIKSVPYLFAIEVCFLAPFSEEIAFRKTLYDVFGNSKVFIIASFLLFGIVHVYSTAESLIDWLYIIPYGVMGASFAIAYQKTDTIFSSMSVHMIHNTLLFLLSVFTK